MKGKTHEDTAPLRICLVSYRSNPHSGGQGVYLKHLAAGLLALGHRVEVVTGPPDPRLKGPAAIHRIQGLDLYNAEYPFRLPTFRELLRPLNFIEWFGVSTMGFPEPFTFGLRAYRFLKKRLHRFDIIHDNQSLSYGIWMLGRRKPLVATIHHPITVDRNIAVGSSGSTWGKLKTLRWYSFISMQRRIAPRLSRIITVSESAKADLCREFSLSEHRCKVIENGVDTNLFYPLEGIRRETNRIIVTNSADMPLKGLVYLLKAIALVAARRGIQLVIVGSPKKNGEVMRHLHQLGLSQTVQFTGRIDHERFRMEYARAAIAVVPSIYEGFGLPAAEAMACKVPVISTTGGALPEVVGDAGLLVPPRSAQALATAILELLDCPERAATLGDAGYERVLRLFTWRRTAERTAAVYREVIDAYREFR